MFSRFVRKCVANWEMAWDLCWDWVLNDDEQCDFNDKTRNNWWSEWCSRTCQQINKNSWKCNSEFDWQILESSPYWENLCSRWKMVRFSMNLWKWSWLCEDENTKSSVKCFAKSFGCGDWIIWDDEKCNICSTDLKDICVTDWDADDDEWEDDPNCKCDKCSKTLKSICVTDWNNNDEDEEDDDENCDCDTCPEKLKKRCIDDGENDDENCKCDKCSEKLKVRVYLL